MTYIPNDPCQDIAVISRELASHPIQLQFDELHTGTPSRQPPKWGSASVGSWEKIRSGSRARFASAGTGCGELGLHPKATATLIRALFAEAPALQPNDISNNYPYPHTYVCIHGTIHIRLAKLPVVPTMEVRSNPPCCTSIPLCRRLCTPATIDVDVLVGPMYVCTPCREWVSMMSFLLIRAWRRWIYSHGG
jgi:hypothetical protein